MNELLFQVLQQNIRVVTALGVIQLWQLKLYYMLALYLQKKTLALRMIQVGQQNVFDYNDNIWRRFLDSEPAKGLWDTLDVKIVEQRQLMTQVLLISQEEFSPQELEVLQDTEDISYIRGILVSMVSQYRQQLHLCHESVGSKQLLELELNLMLSLLGEDYFLFDRCMDVEAVLSRHHQMPRHDLV